MRGDAIRAEILDYLRSQPAATIRDIAAAVHRSVGPVHIQVTQLERDGRLERTPCGECGRTRYVVLDEVVA